LGSAEAREAVLSHPSTAVVQPDEIESTDINSITQQLKQWLPGGDFQIKVAGNEDIGIHPHSLANGKMAIHIVNYQFDRDQDRVITLENVRIQMRMVREVKKIEVHTINGEAVPCEWNFSDRNLQLTIQSLPLYSIIECQ
jgi:hypothetical protein